MPELPEVETVARGLAGPLKGRTLRSLAILRGDVIRTGADALAAALIGRTVFEVRRRGKNVLIAWSSPGVLRVNLGMTGRLHLAPPSLEPEPHTHLRFTFDCDLEVRFRDPRRFGGLWFGPDESAVGLANLGPEPLLVGKADFRERLRGKRPIKSALLDQSLVAGVGNIYADEALHAAGVAPQRLCESLSDAEADRLRAGMRKVLKKAIDCGGSTIRDYISSDGSAGWFQVHHCVYGRTGEPCRTCSTPIEREVIGGRSSHWCPTCQS